MTPNIGDSPCKVSEKENQTNPKQINTILKCMLFRTVRYNYIESQIEYLMDIQNQSFCCLHQLHSLQRPGNYTIGTDAPDALQ